MFDKLQINSELLAETSVQNSVIENTNLSSTSFTNFQSTAAEPKISCCRQKLDAQIENTSLKAIDKLNTDQQSENQSQNSTNNLKFTDKLIDFVLSTKCLAGIYATPAGIMLVNQIQSATCWRCYVFRVMPTAGLCLLGFSGTFVLKKFAEPLGRIIQKGIGYFRDRNKD